MLSIVVLKPEDPNVADGVRAGVTIPSHAVLTPSDAALIQVTGPLPDIQPLPEGQFPAYAALLCGTLLVSESRMWVSQAAARYYALGAQTAARYVHQVAVSNAETPKLLASPTCCHGLQRKEKAELLANQILEFMH